MTTNQQIKALQMLCDAIIASVREVGEVGAPAGALYAAMMAHGISLDHFQQIMGALVQLGKLRQSGDLYYAVN